VIKLFPCRHKGKGKYCHRCADEAVAKEKKESAERAEREREAARNARLAASPVPLDGIPRPVQDEVFAIFDLIAVSTPVHKIPSAIRLSAMKRRDLVKVELRSHYRLVCQETKGRLVPLRVMTHEDYNDFLKET